jgi:hypothetical protein
VDQRHARAASLALTGGRRAVPRQETLAKLNARWAPWRIASGIPRMDADVRRALSAYGSGVSARTSCLREARWGVLRVQEVSKPRLVEPSLTRGWTFITNHAQVLLAVAQQHDVP